MRLTTVNQDIYCDNCSNRVIAVDKGEERHIYCDNCGKYEIQDKTDTESGKCC